MKTYLALALVLVAGLAHAQGAALLSARQATAADRPAIAKARGEATAVAINSHALDSNAITVLLDGKEYRFVGAKTVRHMVDEGKGTTTDIDSWYGTTRDGDSYMTLTRGSQFLGSINIPQRSYELRDNLLIRRGAK